MAISFWARSAENFEHMRCTEGDRYVTDYLYDNRIAFFPMIQLNLKTHKFEYVEFYYSALEKTFFKVRVKNLSNSIQNRYVFDTKEINVHHSQLRYS